MFQALVDHPDAAEPPIRTLRAGLMAGAMCPPSLMRRVIELCDAREFTVGYGLTEASPAVTIADRNEPVQTRVNSIGAAISGTTVRLVDPETDAEGDRGELQLRGEQVMLPEERCVATVRSGTGPVRSLGGGAVGAARGS